MFKVLSSFITAKNDIRYHTCLVPIIVPFLVYFISRLFSASDKTILGILALGYNSSLFLFICVASPILPLDAVWPTCLACAQSDPSQCTSPFFHQQHSMDVAPEALVPFSLMMQKRNSKHFRNCFLSQHIFSVNSIFDKGLFINHPFLPMSVFLSVFLSVIDYHLYY